jgi:hypothetical protein
MPLTFAASLLRDEEAVSRDRRRQIHTADLRRDGLYWLWQ